jgi:hypothetical protein
VATRGKRAAAGADAAMPRIGVLIVGPPTLLARADEVIE